jgi:dephospho-CoA kinase
MIIGLTGESGAGKSTVAKFLEMSGFYIIDCDGISRTLDTDREYVAQIEQAFGAEAITFGGGQKRVNRKALGTMLFGKDAASGNADKLNAISHPIIIARVHAEIAHATEFGRSVIIDAPLLFESGFDKICDATICVTAPFETKLERIMKRDNLSLDDALARLKSQINDDELRARCDYEIDNSGNKDINTQLDSILSALNL